MSHPLHPRLPWWRSVRGAALAVLCVGLSWALVLGLVALAMRLWP